MVYTLKQVFYVAPILLCISCTNTPKQWDETLAHQSKPTLIQESNNSKLTESVLVENTIDLPYTDEPNKAYGCVDRHKNPQFKRIAALKAHSLLLEKINPVRIQSDFEIFRTVSSNNENELMDESSEHRIVQTVKGEQQGRILKRTQLDQYYCVLVGL